ncbi:MAG TPA: ABC transporter, partial [Lachnospiraceae bacterium]|nr:ABC transporter [Lachnospiraceae bacterium]
MILSCQNIYKSFPGNEVLKDVSFHIEENEKAALTGVNGSGKTTMFKIITGEISADSGNVIIPRGKTIGYLAQHQDTDGDMSIYQALRESKKELFTMEEKLRTMESNMKSLSGEELETLMHSYTILMHDYELKNGYAAESEIMGVFKGLGFLQEDMERKVNTLSGGQKTRVSLGRLLLTQPDILLLDEPTNHLDIESISWLESFLASYRGTVLVVSHDRFFLDRIVTKVIEIENGTSMMFPGNYAVYSRKKAMIRNAQYKAYMNQQAEIRHQEAVITKLKSFNREKSIKRAESREKALSKMEVIDKPAELNADMNLKLTPRFESGKDVLEIKGLSKSFGPLTLFSDQDIHIGRGERVAIIGKNGTGKTTLLKMITEQEALDSGTITFGAKVKTGYFDQEHQMLHMDKTVFEEISDEYPALTNTEIRNVLAAFLFTGDQVFSKIGTLSGGEQGRVSLAKLMLSEANFLLLDEPTNHLDINSKEILEDALNNYTGTILYVSHDRYFINKTATRILDLVNQKFVNYIG